MLDPENAGPECNLLRINKQDFDDEIGRFDEEDVQVLETLATFVATQLAESTLLVSADARPGVLGRRCHMRKRLAKAKHGKVGSTSRVAEVEMEMRVVTVTLREFRIA